MYVHQSSCILWLSMILLDFPHKLKLPANMSDIRVMERGVVKTIGYGEANGATSI